MVKRHEKIWKRKIKRTNGQVCLKTYMGEDYKKDPNMYRITRISPKHSIAFKYFICYKTLLSVQ
jgi:hypothetical protein